jgi:ADP-L-glycero-D-manno-heptose 6-epimerase
MYIVTGGAGFIGSAMVWQLNQLGITDILVVDHLATSEKWKNIVPLKYRDYIDRDEFASKIRTRSIGHIDAIIHLGACSATTERDADYLMDNNAKWTVELATWAVERETRFIYASSAATYGDGAQGFDDTADPYSLRPLNMYGYSKHLSDVRLHEAGLLEHVAGIKFFNVYGPNEYHKGHMASVVLHSHRRIREEGAISLFKSYKPEYADGAQVRDFIYVKDVVDALAWLMQTPSVNGIFNLGTGQARSWNDLANAIYAGIGQDPVIKYIEMPDALQGKYQYFTEAKMTKLRAAGYTRPFTSLEEAVKDYVTNHLDKELAPLGW